jgi:sugar phosphate isomerase/epimerase
MRIALLALALAASGSANDFFALDTAMVRNLTADRIQPADLDTVAALGYHGIAPVALDAPAWQHLNAHVFPLLAARKLKLYAVYSWVRVDKAGHTLAPGLRDNLATLRDRKTVLWLNLRSADFKPSDPAADPLAVAAIRDLAASGVAISLYPHTRDLAEKVTDVVRLANAVNLPNVTVTFNLCHWLRNEGVDTMDRVLDLAAPRLSLVTINGADRDGKDWIQPLDQGTFDVPLLLAALKKRGYRGPIGLQGYDVARRLNIAPAENLRRSIAAWKKW